MFCLCFVGIKKYHFDKSKFGFEMYHFVGQMLNYIVFTMKKLGYLNIRLSCKICTDFHIKKICFNFFFAFECIFTGN